METETRAAVAARLAAVGVVGEAAEFILAAGARARHEARVVAAWAVALAWAAESGAQTPEGREVCALTAVLLELAGAGGELGQGALGPGCPGTERFGPFRALGKGRRHATDGGAWTHAIEAAWRRAVTPLSLTLSLNEEEGVFLAAECREGDWVGTCVLPREERTTALVRAILRALVGDPTPRHRLCVAGVDISLTGAPAAWAAAYNAGLGL